MSMFSEHYDDPKGVKGALLAIGLFAAIFLIAGAVTFVVFCVL